jgi:phenylacetate-CoA ligase
MHSYLAKSLNKFVNRMEGDRKWQFIPEVERVCSLSREEMLRDQWERLLAMIKFAYEKISFYRDRYNEAGVTLKSIQSPSDLTKIPVLVREDIRRNQESLMDPSLDPSKLIVTATGGTTDSPVHLYLDQDCLYKRRASTQVFSTWFGYAPGDPIAFLWGAQQDFPQKLTLKSQIRQWMLGRTLFLPSSYLNNEIMWDYYKKLVAFRPNVLQAYPTPLYLFANFLELNNLQLHIKNINVAAEHLYDYQRQKIETVFETKIFNWYGARELGHIATECYLHKGMHVNTFGVYIEVIKEGRQAQDNGIGEIVVTDLLNKAMPLIRYKIGDIGAISHEACSCRSNLPLLEDVGGRYADTFKKRDGTYIPGVALTNRVIKEYSGIEMLQIVQKDYEHLQLNLVKGDQYCEEVLLKLEEQLCNFMHERLTFDVCYVDQIYPERSGKILFCKSEIESSNMIRHQK